ncbi:UNVERIFIED_ORG: hypothetical protein M2382_003665 [Enterobacter sp. BIGb0239]
MTFTKEQLIARARFLIKRYEDSLANYPDQDGVAMDLELARMALAGMEAELERGKIRRFELDMSDCDSCGQDCGADMVEDLDGDYVLWDEVLPHLYQHAEYDKPQPLTTSERAELENYRNAQQVVPEWTNEQCLEFLSIAFRHAEIKGDLEMDDIRLGVKMVNACRAAMLQGAEPVTTAYKLPEGWVAVPVDATRAMIDAARSVEEDGYDAMHKAMIAAAPQQEVKP